MSGKAIRNTKPIKDNRKQTKLSIIIPSASEGSRMKSIGPRSLIQVGTKTLIQHQNDILLDTYPNSDVILITGFEGSKLMNKVPKNVMCIENERYLETNVLRSISIGLRAAIQPAILIIYGDLVFNAKLLDFNINKSCIIYDNSGEVTDETEVGCTIHGDKLENMFYGLSNIWTSVVYLTGKELSLMRNIAYNKQKEKLYTWEAINEIIHNGGEFMAYCPKGSKSIDIDSSRDMDKISQII
jgi:choline kinase